MVVTIRNTQRTCRLNVELVRSCLENIMMHAGYVDWDIGAWFTSDATIRRLNRTYRQQQGVTDILSFARHQLPAPEQFPSDLEPDERDLGDMIISLPYVLRYCNKNDISLNDHLPLLLVHGVTHLLGYDHETDLDYQAMQPREDKILELYRQQSNLPGSYNWMHNSFIENELR